MKRIISLIVCSLMLLALVPAVFADGWKKPDAIKDLPFEFAPPTYISVSEIKSGDARTNVSISQPDDLIAFFCEKDDAYLAESEVPGSVEAFYNKYGITDIYVDVQTDWAIDDVNDEVSGWHYRPVWDNDGLNDNCVQICGPWDMQGFLWYPKTTIDAWLFDGVYYNPDEDPSENRDWLGLNEMPDTEEAIPGALGLKDQVREGQIKFNDDHYGTIEIENHTLYVRARYELTVRTMNGEEEVTNLYFSDWSETAAVGKDAPQWEPLVEGEVAAPDISNLRMTMDEFNDYPVVKFDLAVPDELAKAVAEVEVRGGGITLCTEGRVPGLTNWVELQGEWEIKPGAIEMKLISLVDPELEENEGKVLITINTPLELRCRFFISQYEAYGGDHIGEFYTDYSTVLKLKGAETVQGSGDVDGNGKLNAKDVTMLMKHLVGIENSKFNFAEADFNGDGKVNAKDVTALMKYLVKNPSGALR